MIMSTGPAGERITLADNERAQLTEDFAAVLLSSYTLAELVALDETARDIVGEKELCRMAADQRSWSGLGPNLPISA